MIHTLSVDHHHLGGFPLFQSHTPLIGTRPDITFAARWLSWYNNNPTEEHIKYAQYIPKYLKGTKSNMMEFLMPDWLDIQTQIGEKIKMIDTPHQDMFS